MWPCPSGFTFTSSSRRSGVFSGKLTQLFVTFWLFSFQECLQETQAFLSKKFSGVIAKMELVDKEDLDLANHLVGIKQRS